MANTGNIRAPESACSTPLVLQKKLKFFAEGIQNRFIFNQTIRDIEGFPRYFDLFCDI